MPTVDEIREALAAATQWPWRTGRASARHGGYPFVVPLDKAAEADWVIEPTGYIRDEDLALLAAAPAWLDWLCGQNDSLQHMFGQVVDAKTEIVRQRDAAERLCVVLADVLQRDHGNCPPVRPVGGGYPIIMPHGWQEQVEAMRRRQEGT